jgi:hypothetical protein
VATKKKPKAHHKPSGRPPAEIDKEQLKQLCAIQCTQAEIAAVFGVSRRTIENYAANPEYSAIFEQGRELGKMTVRRQQFKLLDAGSVTMAIWLGKQLLGQKDEVNVKTDPNTTTYAELLTVIDRIDRRQLPAPAVN